MAGDAWHLKRICGALALALCMLLVSVSTRALDGVWGMDIETCKADRGETDGQVWKLLREFRRLAGFSPRNNRKGEEKRFAWIDNHGGTIALYKGDSESSPSEEAHAQKAKFTGGTLKITIVSASNLHSEDWWGKSDPFVKCVQKGKSDVFFQTPHIWNQHNPVWNYETEIAYTASDITLKCAIYDLDLYSAHDKIAEVSIPAKELADTDGVEKTYGKLKVKGKLIPDPAPIAPPPDTLFSFGCDARVRKDWNDLTTDERNLYLEAVNKIKTTPRLGATDAGPGNNIYDTFVMIHGERVNKGYAHQTAGFLGWHRKFLIEFEDALRSVDEKFKCLTIPYWDWTTETFNCVSATGTPCSTYHEASALLSDFGGPGDASKTSNTYGSSGSGDVGCVTTGPFAGWVDHNGKCLSRGVNWEISKQKPFTGRTRMLEILTMPEYGSDYGFRAVLEGAPHGSTHNYLGGHMRSFISPADPIFFSHHCYVDKLWAVWQDCHDYDTLEVKNTLLSNPDDPRNQKFFQQSGQDGEDDHVNSPMPFYLNTGPTEVSFPTCEASQQDEACKSCVNGIDGWCRSNNWDTQCCGHRSSNSCFNICGPGEAQPNINMASQGNTVLKDWVTGDRTPGHMQSVHEMPEGRSYSYAPDEIERALKQHSPGVFAGCNLDSHDAAQEKHGVLAETQRLHHEGKPYGKAAFAFAMLMQQASKDVKEQNKRKALIRSARKSDDVQFRRDSLRAAQQMECKEMAGDCEHYREKYNCKVDQPRFWIPWMGVVHWSAVMANATLKAQVFQDPCCAGDLEALEPGAVASGKETLTPAGEDP